MKKIILLLLIPLVSFGQIKVKDLPTTTTGLNGDHLIKNDSIGGTKKITISDFKSTYFSTLPTYSLSAASPITYSLGVIGLDTSTAATQYDISSKQDIIYVTSPLSKSTNTISIPAASSVANGYLSNSDWTLFNSKESALTFTTGVTRTSNTVKVDTSLISTKTNISLNYIPNTGATVNPNLNNVTINNVNLIDSKAITNSGMISTTSISATYWNRYPYELCMAITDEATAITTTDTNSFTLYLPTTFTATSVWLSVGTAQSSGSTFTVDIKKNNTSIFSTKLSVDNAEFNSGTAATPAVLSTTAFARGDRLTIYRFQVGTGAKGAKVCIKGYGTW